MAIGTSWRHGAKLLQGHEKTDPLTAPGQADLTAHVDF